MQKRLFRTVSIGQREQISGKFEQIDEQRFYTIECRLNSFCLRSQPKSWRPGDPLRVTGNLLERNYMKQLWMFKRINNSEFEIVHVKTDLVVTVEDFQAQLRVGGEKPNQQRFEVIPWKNGLVRIKDYTGAILRLDGVLEAADFSERDEAQLFRLHGTGMFEIPWLKDTIFILTDNKASSLDLANAAREGERDIIVYKRNLRMNQRWRFELVEEGEKGEKREGERGGLRVHILSALTDMFVVHNRDSGGIMQATYPEQWLIEQTEIKEYIYIRHGKLGEYLSYTPTGEIYFASTKKAKWYIQNGMEGLYLKKSTLLQRSISI